MIKKFKAKNIIYLIGVIFIMGFLSGCSNQNTKTDATSGASYSKVTPKEAKERLDSEDEIILLDVRTKQEYNSGHIEDSILIPVSDLKEDAEDVLKDKETPIIIYCRSGNRSATASKILLDLGYKKVYDLGGINKWPYDVVK